MVCFFEAFLAGCFPTWSKDCRESPKILGVAQAFACGVFIAIALIHILPEESALWVELNPGVDMLFPLPFFLVFCGYTLILLIDKVAFDAHALFEDGDPVAKQLAEDLKRSFRGIPGDEATPEERRHSLEKAETDAEKAVQNYMNTENKFTTRMKGAMEGDTEENQPLMSGENEQVNAAKINPSYTEDGRVNGTYVEKP